MPGAPSVVLEASGQPTSCCFSGRRLWCNGYDATAVLYHLLFCALTYFTASLIHCFPSPIPFCTGSQAFLVLGGTAEGTLHLWDLRESNSLHANRWPITTLHSFLFTTPSPPRALHLRPPIYLYLLVA